MGTILTIRLMANIFHPLLFEIKFCDDKTITNPLITKKEALYFLRNYIALLMDQGVP